MERAESPLRIALGRELGRRERQLRGQYNCRTCVERNCFSCDYNIIVHLQEMIDPVGPAATPPRRRKARKPRLRLVGGTAT